jgi:hypothetical protein
MMDGNGAAPVLETVTVRETIATLGSCEALEEAIDRLTMAGIDRRDIDLIDGPPPGTAAADGHDHAHRHTYVAREEVAEGVWGSVGALAYVGATAAAGVAVASGAALAAAAGVALVGAGAGAGLGSLIGRRISRAYGDGFQRRVARDGIVLSVRSETPGCETRVTSILYACGGRDVRSRDVEIEKCLDDIPLSSLNIDPWLGKARIGDADGMAPPP